MDDCTASVQEEVVLEVMPVSSNFSDYKDTFTPCKSFPSRETAISWLQMIGRENKFVLVTKRSDARGIKRRGMVKLACERPGTYRGLAQRVWKGKAAKILKKSRNDENARTPTGMKKCGCPFLINVKENADSLWYVTVICGMHNHDTAGRLDKGSGKLRMRVRGSKFSSSGRLVHLRLLWSASRKLRMRVGGHRGLQSEARQCGRENKLSLPIPQKRPPLLGRRNARLFHKCVVPVDARKVDLTWLMVIA
ncbi:hypothetical protein Scep_012096 [Stephania cephalantha]|uniref:FAR1 domain-containing protein n=1 Tax=Stephania cephalantha TaxID=152367 RepID=A0AAP0JEJ0_9MAGN